MLHATVRTLAVAALTLGVAACGQQNVKQAHDHDEATAIAEPLPSLSITSPKEGEVLPSGDVTVTFDLKNYQVSPSAQHVHLILDNEPYQPIYDVSKPVVLKNVAPGSHTLRAFPSRAWHESIKNPEAFAFVNFAVKKADNARKIDPNAPLLTFSRPKGTYEGAAADRILMDFWLRNAELSPTGYKVRYTLDGKSTVLTEWLPVYFENLPSGTHTLKLELLDPAGKVVPGAYNSTTREFTVKR
ncbi:hypothetical protein J7643_12070 [bacterium]|nr:hypothetical protein [bacterium]